MPTCYDFLYEIKPESIDLIDAAIRREVILLHTFGGLHQPAEPHRRRV
jgi:hypothetical protein